MKKINIQIQDMSYATREALKTLRTNVLFSGNDKQVLLVTSCFPEEGKTTSSIRLAYSLAELKKSVILIDADMRKSAMASRLLVQGADKGLSHYLSGQCTLADAVVATNVPKMHLMMSGPLVPNPTELLASNRFQSMIASLRKVYDYVVIDSPPLGMVVDSAIIAPNCDGSIMVVESAKTKRRIARDVKEKLEKTGCPMLGVVLTKVDYRKQKGYYGKYYGKNYGKKGYGEYYQSEEKKDKKEKKQK